MKNNYGTVKTDDGIVIQVTQQASYDNNNQYHAHGEDEQGNEYLITWDVSEKYSEAEEKNKRKEKLITKSEHYELNDEELEELAELKKENFDWLEDDENACDWDNPSEIELL